MNTLAITRPTHGDSHDESIETAPSLPAAVAPDHPIALHPPQHRTSTARPTPRAYPLAGFRRPDGGRRDSEGDQEHRGRLASRESSWLHENRPSARQQGRRGGPRRGAARMSGHFSGWRTAPLAQPLKEHGAPLSKRRSTRQRRDREHEEQLRLFVFVDQVLVVDHPHLADALGDVFAVPNGGHRNRRTAGRLRAEGVRRGVPDVLGLIPMREHHGFAVELKADGGRPTREQIDRIARLQRRGYVALWCEGWVCAAKALCAYLEVPWRKSWTARVEVLAQSTRATRPHGPSNKEGLPSPSDKSERSTRNSTLFDTSRKPATTIARKVR